MDKKEKYMTDQTALRAEELFAEEGGLYCAESVLLAIAENRGVQTDLIPRIASGFCSGMARSGGQCGAVSGGVMALSLVFGRDTGDQPVDQTYGLIQEFLQEFEKKFGSTNCQQLINCHLGTPEGQKYFMENNLRQHCQAYTREAARMAMVLIEGMRLT
jgi:C_GCAxxG_C_C family probable redox protein